MLKKKPSEKQLAVIQRLCGIAAETVKKDMLDEEPLRKKDWKDLG